MSVQFYAEPVCDRIIGKDPHHGLRVLYAAIEHRVHEFRQLLQDDLLRQTAALSSSDEDETDIDSDSRIFTQRPGKQGRLNIPADLSDGFHDLRDDGDDYRIYPQ